MHFLVYCAECEWEGDTYAVEPYGMDCASTEMREHTEKTTHIEFGIYKIAARI